MRRIRSDLLVNAWLVCIDAFPDAPIARKCVCRWC